VSAPARCGARELLAVGVCVALAGMFLLSGCGGSAGPMKLDTGGAYRFDGWGVSLAWWANVIGSGPLAADGSGSWSRSERDKVLSTLFGDPAQPGPTLAGQGTNPLGLNIVRYNIGASPVVLTHASPSLPADCRSFRAGGAVPSLTQASSEPPDPSPQSPDLRQIDVLRDAKSLIDRSNVPGENTLIEAFANSPPWFLTSDNCPAGSRGSSSPFGGSIADAAEGYAVYLLSVASAFHGAGIDFHTLEPFNEPDERDWGKCRDKHGGCQEGANFSAEAQGAVVDALCWELGDRHDWPSLGTRLISANDALRLRQFMQAKASWIDSACVGQVNVHGYDPDGRRAEVRAAAAAAGKPLWMSEYGLGPCSKPDATCPCSRSDTCSGLGLARRIADDLQDMRPRAWVYWTALEDKGGWGLLQTDHLPDPPRSDDALAPTARYWALGQYSRYIRGGAIIYPIDQSPDQYDAHSDAPRIVVAKGANGQITIVATNPAEHKQPLSVDLAPLESSGSLSRHRLSLGGGQATVSDAGKIALHGSVLDDTLFDASVTTYVLGATPVPSAGGATSPDVTFVKDANAVCREVNSKVRALSSPTDLQSLGTLASQESSLAREALPRLEALTPPPGATAAYTELLNTTREQAEKLSEIKAAADQGDDQAATNLADEVNALANAGARAAASIGLNECAKNVSPEG
jgi:hypothetical protein